MQYAFDLLKWVTGDLSIEAITRSQCRDCRDLFLKLPVRALRYSNKYSPHELVCMDKVPMSPKTDTFYTRIKEFEHFFIGFKIFV